MIPQTNIKRLFDIAVSGAALLLLSPLFLIISIAIVLMSPGAIFYKATRVGRHGQIFKMYKFRTMVTGADRIGPGLTTRNDQRITPIGRFLRKTKLDELPQLINVVRGQMSLVGPRPEDPRYVALYTPEQRAVLNVRPGLTSPASIAYRDEASLITGSDWEAHYVQVIMPDKLSLDLVYAQNPSVKSDIVLIAKTIQKLLTK